MLKSTGYVRHVDELGRVVLPVSVRRERLIEAKDDIEIYVDGDNIILEKYVPGCLFCGGSVDLGTFKGKPVCRECLTGIERSATVAD